MKLRYILTLFISTQLCIASFGQTQQDINNLFRDANAYFYFEDYEEALALYLDIYESFPNNQNIDYRIGICYLNIAGKKEKAIPYLERAVQNVSHRYNESSIKETQAPIDAYFYLGNAYFIANRLNDAERTYNTFRNSIKNERKYDMEYLTHQFNGLEQARTIKNYPVNYLQSNLGEVINNRFPNFNPVISGDGKTFAFTTKERFYQSINVSRKTNGKWGRPANITLDLVVDGVCSTLSLNYDGTEIYLFKDDNHDGNIYVSNFTDGKWSPMKKLNENINTEAYETHASISADGSTLYFASNREGGFGGLDIYYSQRDANGNWGSAINLGKSVNTQFDENTPFITNDEKTLFFASDGHKGVGGYDIYFSQLQSDKKWSSPINIGYPINTTDDEVFYQPIDEGAMGYMAAFDPKGYGETDIVQIEIFLPRYKRSIVSSSDYYARKASLPPKTLIVDTVNLSGTALLDPTRPEHLNYIASDSRYTLFFEGKPYDLKDQSIAQELFATRKTERLTADDQPEPITLLPSSIVKDELIAQNDSTATQQANSDSLFATLNRYQNNNIEAKDEITEKGDSIAQVAEILTNNDSLSLKTQSELFDILSALANDKLSSELIAMLNQNWDLPSDVLKIRIKSLTAYADSTNQSAELSKVFASLMDIITAKSSEGKTRQSRQIAQKTLDEEFFFRLQKIKRKASSGLALLLDDAILTQPEISSFSTLLAYLMNEKSAAFKPYINEFLMLIAEESINSFNSLSKEHKDEIRETLTHKHAPVFGILLISFVAFAGLVILLFALRKSKKKKK